jgi:hypothetical protein
MSTESLRSIGKPDKKKMQTVHQIFSNLLEITELYPQYSLVQHLATIQRKKNSEGKEFYNWTEEEFLKRIEQHKVELEGDDFMNIGDEDEYEG